MIDLFTKQERIIIVVLLSGLLIGAGVKIYNSKFSTTANFSPHDKNKLDSLEIRITEKARLIDSLILLESQKKIGDKKRFAKRKSGSSITRQKRQQEITDLKIDINTASAEELQLLPKVGPVLASRIIQYRNAHGRFNSLDELAHVKGIGEKTLASLKPHLIIKNK